ncbi:MAG: hypothetical protein K6T81_07440 [Alicyclobacillus macrosporangiidus]|uniref:hypothetical protein n=1 Tax=Alicyclobacillus macrosporangiidus TaxID=392015 RepID=UPI0026EC670E|nr:hypothetical protein [Alicyclobacillus macrosporangiidus]MCL6598562.1 hypothetical protein [Alicyclobacillus macrosporangiidus]
MDWKRTVAVVIVGVIAFVLLMAFLNLAIKLALFAALVALAFYWFARARESWRRRRP